jgi:hypothetical protein
VSENPRHEQEPVSIDGALYAIADGEWTRVGFSRRAKDPDAKPLSLPEGHVSVDGAVYAIIDGELERVGAVGNPNSADEEPFSLPDGKVSVDGALIAVDGAWKHNGAGAPQRSADPALSR